MTWEAKFHNFILSRGIPMLKTNGSRTMFVADYMTHKVFTIRLDKKLLAVKDLMGWAHVRHVPVIDSLGHLVGMLSHRDLLAASLTTEDDKKTEFDRKRHLWTIPVDKVMREQVVCIAPTDTIAHAARIMRHRKIGALPVVQNKKLVGIITEYDLLRVIEETFGDVTEAEA